jgi:hypothetical protein
MNLIEKYRALKAHKGAILKDPYSSMQQAIEEIDQGYKPGTLEWMKRSRPEDWKRMVAIEAMIKEKALTGDIEELRKALEEYRKFMLVMVKVFSSEGEEVTLFDTLRKGDKKDE